MLVSLGFFVPSKCIDWVCRNRPSIQTPFYCTRSQGHISGGKTCAHTNVSSGITGLLLYLEPSRVWEPPLEDTGHEAELRRQQALSAAVDVPSLLRSAQGYNVESPLSLSSVMGSNSVKADSRTGKVIYASSDVLPSPLAFFLAEFPHKGHRPSRRYTIVTLGPHHTRS
jgi:hypothetical protein